MSLVRALLVLALAVPAAYAADPVPAAPAANPQELAAIKATALDYAEGWYEGNAERMARALHPELAKRIVRVGPDGKAALDQMGASRLVAMARAGAGKNTPPAQRLAEVTVFDVFGNAATVKVSMSGWIDYLHVGKVDGRWVIVNVLWEMRPNPAAH